VKSVTKKFVVVFAFTLTTLAVTAFAQAQDDAKQDYSSSKKLSASAAKEAVPPASNATAPTGTPDATTPKPATATAPELEAADVYRIGIEDDLQVSVWHEPELSVQVTVRPDGVITLPLLNDIKVTGLTTKELQDLLLEKLKAYVTEPQVTVIVRGIKSRKVYLAGQLAHPGAVQLNSRKTVLQLLAEVGGLGPFAKDNMYILRNEGGQTKKIPFSYKRAMRGEPKDDILLQPGDVIVAP
jgi:polysaccharide biosynthesis/export protein